MKNLNFLDKVKKYFEYLESEYGFKITRETNSIARPETDGAVEYTTNATGILIDSETGYVTVHLYRAEDGKRYYITPVDLYEYLNTSNEEKQLLLSTDPANESVAIALSNKKSLLNQPGWRGSRGTAEDLDRELRNFSSWLNDHAAFFLRGDFSLWHRLYEYKIHRARADRLRRGDDELVYSRVKDANGSYKLIKQSVFQDDLTYIEKLKDEFDE